jgi:hypothetical protein
LTKTELTGTLAFGTTTTAQVLFEQKQPEGNQKAKTERTPHKQRHIQHSTLTSDTLVQWIRHL